MSAIVFTQPLRVPLRHRSSVRVGCRRGSRCELYSVRVQPAPASAVVCPRAVARFRGGRLIIGASPGRECSPRAGGASRVSGSPRPVLLQSRHSRATRAARQDRESASPASRGESPHTPTRAHRWWVVIPRMDQRHTRRRASVSVARVQTTLESVVAEYGVCSPGRCRTPVYTR